MNRHSYIQPLTFCGRLFSLSELEMIREVASGCSALSLTEISRTVCELLSWKRPNGHLKSHECRQLLERLRDQGWLRLPEVRALGAAGPRRVRPTLRSDPQPPISGPPRWFEPLRLTVVSPDEKAESRLWKEYVERYHYLGHRVPFGANLRYLVRSARASEQVLACLLWSSPAWKIAARDRWIGWSDQQRAANLQLIVNNSRFLILPWIRAVGLASKILGYCARQLPSDWERLYGYRPLLLETLVDAERFRGTCYRAANWIELGLTQGRGRMDRDHAAHQRTPKLLFVYPLCRQAQQRLRNAVAPSYSEPPEQESQP